MWMPRLWENLGYFLHGVIPAAEAAGMRMAIHPDDPPWEIFGLPRIITTERPGPLAASG